MRVTQVDFQQSLENAARLPVRWRRLFRLAMRWSSNPVVGMRSLGGSLLHRRSAPGQVWWALPRSQRRGVNVVGFVDGEFGLGVMARSLINQLHDAGIPYRIVANEVRGHRFVPEQFENNSCAENFPVNIAVTTADRWQIDAMRLCPEVDLRLPTIGYVAWELERVPLEFVKTLRLFDEVWGISSFCAVNVSKPLKQLPLCLPIQIKAPENLQPLNLAELGMGQIDRQHLFVVGFCFDAASYIERKNPLGVLQAFQKAFPQDEELSTRPCLILKTHNTERAANEPHWKKLLELAARDKRIHILDRKLSTLDTWRLLMAFDCYMSLHRAEGLGLTIGESLVLGKPTICTAYGGVTDYADWPGFIGVGNELTAIKSGQYVGGTGFAWAQPDLDDACLRLRTVYHQATDF